MKRILSKKQKRKRMLILSAILLFLLAAAAVGLLCAKRTKQGPLEGPFRVAKVYDGDTISVLIGNTETTVRMIGIDTPESVNRDPGKNTPEGMEVSLWLHEYLEGRKVWLEYDEQRTDRYGRTLAYVWLDEGRTMLEDVLLENGMALTLSIEPNLRYAARFSELERQAKRAGAGFWGSGFFQ